MTIINEHVITRFFPAVDTPLGSSLGWMVLALGALGVAVVLLAIVSMFTGRRRTSSYSRTNEWSYSGETYGDSSFTGNDAAWFDGESSSWFDSGDSGTSDSSND